ncbi:MAG: methionine biosynthesis protein MetW [Candidatus Gastranaerophilales bacterium]|nr:methionine biosynthesis protein MetW [Candidatus Gastranaerophilales bacterium]
MNNTENLTVHLNYSEIVKLIEPNSKVLDLGCGDGTLLERLIKEKNVSGLGVEIDQNNVIQSIHKGLSVIQGDIDEGLADFADNDKDYVILNQTLQSTQKPDYVIREMLRVGKKAIVSFPNFAYWKVRMYLLLNGKMPKSNILPYDWYDTPNIHLLTVRDFFDFCEQRKIKIEKSILMRRGKVIKSRFKKVFADIFAEEVIFVISQ